MRPPQNDPWLHPSPNLNFTKILVVQEPHPLPYLLAAKQLVFLVNFIPVLKKVQTKKAKNKKLRMMEMVLCWTDLMKSV